MLSKADPTVKTDVVGAVSFHSVALSDVASLACNCKKSVSGADVFAPWYTYQFPLALLDLFKINSGFAESEWVKCLNFIHI